MFVVRIIKKGLKALYLTVLTDALYSYLISRNKISEKNIIRYSGFFDAEYYLCHYPEAGNFTNPLEHYLKHGAEKGNNPSKAFDALFYYRANPEFLLTDTNPVVHYITKGQYYGAIKGRVLDSLEDIEKKRLKVVQYFNSTSEPVCQITSQRNDGSPSNMAVFTHNLNLEGATLVCRDIILGVRKQENIIPIIFSPSNGVLNDFYKKKGIKVVIYPELKPYKINSLEEFGKYIDDISVILNQYNIDLVYGNTILSFWTAYLASQLNKPSILHIHESEPINYHVNNRKLDFVPLIVEAFRLSKKVIFVAESTREQYQPYNKNNNFVVIKNSLDISTIPRKFVAPNDIRKSLNISESELMFINVATVTNRKGQIDIINALQHLDKKTLNLVHFVFIGDVNTDYSQYLHKLVNELRESQSNKIHFIEKTSSVFNYYNAADAFLFTSRIESYPKVIQEAMYFQLPIITTQVDGITEQLLNSVSGLFYQAGDANALSVLIDKVVVAPHLRSQLAENTYLAFEKMIDPKEMIERFKLLL